MRATGYGLWARGYGLMLMVTGCGGDSNGGYEARGTVEVHEVDLAPLAPVRVASVQVDEGAMVRAGDTVAVLRQIDLPATIEAQRAVLAAAEAKLRDLEAGSRPQEIRKAEADLAAAKAEADRTSKALERAKTLVADNAISRQQYDDAVAADRVARERVQAAEEAYALARAGSRPEQIRAARAEVESARAAVQQVMARSLDLILVSPVNGIVLGRHAEPGEALGPNVPVLTIGETANPYVRVFLPQSLVSRLIIGAPVTVVTEDKRMLPGRVAAINPKAEFTPRVALTEQERADLMFGVKIAFENPVEAPHPGLWVTVRVPRSNGQSDGRSAGRSDSTR